LEPGPRVTGGIPMLRVKDLQGGEVDIADAYLIEATLDAQYGRTKLEGGEVLLSIQGSVGRTAIVPESMAGANVSRTLAVMRPVVSEFGSWLWMWFQSPEGQRAMQEATGGTTRDSLNLRDLRK